MSAVLGSGVQILFTAGFVLGTTSLCSNSSALIYGVYGLQSLKVCLAHMRDVDGTELLMFVSEPRKRHRVLAPVGCNNIAGPQM